MLEYAFAQKALVAGTLVAVICAAIGVFIVLRKLSFMVDGIAHFSLSGIALGFLLKTNIIVTTLITAVLSAFGMNYLREKGKITGDSTIGIFFPLGLALGILFLSLGQSQAVDIVSYLFGSILAISDDDMLFIIISFIITIIVLYFANKEFLHIAFNEESAKASGMPISKINYLFYALVALSIVSAIRVAGIMMVSALMIIPPATSLQFRKSFRTTIIISIIVAVLSTWIGLFGSFYYDIPTGVAIVIASLIFFGISLIFR